MQPIVNGLEGEFGTEVEFLQFNAQDGAEGEAYFQQLGLPGHPSIVIFSTDGREIYQGLGTIDEDLLRQEITQVLNET